MSTAGTKGVPRREREQQILDAAAAEFAHRGYAGTSLAMIAATAGISKPLIVTYFGSKDGLYVACAERAGNNLCGRIELALDSDGGTARLAADTLRAFIEALTPRPHDWNVIFDRTIPRDGVAYDAARQIRRRLAQQAARGVAAAGEFAGGTDANDLSILTDVWMSTVGAVVNWWLRHPETSAGEMIERCQRLVATITGNSAQGGA
ncbi:TetR/AcrR family transcriptional regulator [Hoyosella sp. YIM 151337]|uniref:TetR/AcrR family transcriptional regulator n=1 Tax=Hoyosella sp. YIM 151337 TaxID=2992742 RepID=UPI002235B8B1|nr:TetR/AcrR family transcriptional regulator [Hoyosella sp. YIM 151337]MCW4351720.1 TetR/AcrR family transcriptional regulator [Hoyosella sp. YIM 151337]